MLTHLYPARYPIISRYTGLMQVGQYHHSFVPKWNIQLINYPCPVKSNLLPFTLSLSSLMYSCSSMGYPPHPLLPLAWILGAHLCSTPGYPQFNLALIGKSYLYHNRIGTHIDEKKKNKTCWRSPLCFFFSLILMEIKHNICLLTDVHWSNFRKKKKMFFFKGKKKDLGKGWA